MVYNMRLNYRLISLIILFHLASPSILLSSDRSIVVTSRPYLNDCQANRVALVIGNGSYKSSPLKNPVNDARDIHSALKKAGFQVTCKIDANKREMEEAIREFGNKLARGGAGLFFYAGHGMQVKGINYLVPARSNIEKEADIRYEAVDAGRVLAEMESAGNGLNIIILDACRDNPFARSFRSSRRGLARMDAPTGTFIAYSTSPDSVALDGNGKNGVFTKYLLQAIAMQGLPIEQVMKQVRRSVMDETKNSQVPWDSSSLTGDFYFHQPESLDGQPVIVHSVDSYDIPKTHGDDSMEIWDLPEISPPITKAASKTIVKSATAVGLTSGEACAKATTEIARHFFNGRPSDLQFQESVYRMYCNVIKRMPKDRIRVEVSIEFYKP